MNYPFIHKYHKDQDLVRKAMQKDRMACKTLYDRVLIRIKKQMYFFLRRHDEDVLQNIFLEIFKSLHTYKGEASLETWAGSIAFRQYHEIKQKKAFAPDNMLPLEEDILQNFELSNNSTENQIEARQTLSRLYTSLDSLDEKSRTAFILYELNGYDLKEISAITEVPLFTIASRLKKAREHLEKYYQEYFDVSVIKRNYPHEQTVN